MMLSGDAALWWHMQQAATVFPREPHRLLSSCMAHAVRAWSESVDGIGRSCDPLWTCCGAEF
jgi:hypothetical protein